MEIHTAMQKPKQYDWKDSNLALFGSDTEKKVTVLLLLFFSFRFGFGFSPSLSVPFARKIANLKSFETQSVCLSSHRKAITPGIFDLLW